ncbi:hypothetical protein H5410_038828 [Solanum commersonii]|uniref:Uncharacterized protein n=1 Tax=Solanum commersonii TaxID=4109 RepID=A0A9J5YEA4_SOLCO|nr:hypothetical protein H5410_038828 [Solanum commersonii]
MKWIENCVGEKIAVSSGMHELSLRTLCTEQVTCLEGAEWFTATKWRDSCSTAPISGKLETPFASGLAGVQFSAVNSGRHVSNVSALSRGSSSSQPSSLRGPKANLRTKGTYQKHHRCGHAYTFHLLNKGAPQIGGSFESISSLVSTMVKAPFLVLA